MGTGRALPPTDAREGSLRGSLPPHFGQATDSDPSTSSSKRSAQAGHS